MTEIVVGPHHQKLFHQEVFHPQELPQSQKLFRGHHRELQSLHSLHPAGRPQFQPGFQTMTFWNLAGAPVGFTGVPAIGTIGGGRFGAGETGVIWVGRRWGADGARGAAGEGWRRAGAGRRSGVRLPPGGVPTGRWGTAPPGGRDGAGLPFCCPFACGAANAQTEATAKIFPNTEK